jgi:hypothetical protein
MDPDVQRMAQVLFVISAFSAFAVTVSLAAWYVVRKFRNTPVASHDNQPAIGDSRFSRLEDAVDSIAIEVERIAEAQRFTAKLMSERLPDRLTESTPDRAKQR